MSNPEARLKELGIVLGEEKPPMANYLTYKISNNLVYVSGKAPVSPDGLVIGKVGSDLTLEQGYTAARLAGIQILTSLRAAAGGNLDNIKGIVKLLGFVASAPGFYDAPKVINGCSDLLVAVFGEAGRHARSAIPASHLPSNIAVEIELIAELKA